MTTVFLDTVGLLAVWDTRDQWHSDARAAFEQVITRSQQICSTDLILFECGNAAARTPYRSTVAEFRDGLEREGRLIIPTTNEIRRAWETYASQGQDAAGIVDLVSMSVMKRLGISVVFSNDKHFRAAGFQTLF